MDHILFCFEISNTNFRRNTKNQPRTHLLTQACQSAGGTFRLNECNASSRLCQKATEGIIRENFFCRREKFSYCPSKNLFDFIDQTPFQCLINTEPGRFVLQLFPFLFIQVRASDQFLDITIPQKAH
jgi:hypothetical protein